MRIVLLVVVLLAAAACGNEPAATTTAPPEFPSVAVARWLDALGQDDYTGAATHVEPTGAAIVLAVENALSDDEFAELLESGWTETLATSFWSSFSQDFALFAGSGVDELVVGRHADLSTPTGTFAAVTVEVAGSEGLILTRRDAAGRWQVDLLASMGGAFVPLVFDRVVELGAGGAGDLIRSALADTALASLDAAAVAYPEDARLETEIARIRQVLGAS